MIPSHMDINKGIELILRGERQPKPKQTPKFFDIKLSLFGREFRLSFDIKKKTSNYPWEESNGNNSNSCNIQYDVLYIFDIRWYNWLVSPTK